MIKFFKLLTVNLDLTLKNSQLRVATKYCVTSRKYYYCRRFDSNRNTRAYFNPLWIKSQFISKLSMFQNSAYHKTMSSSTMTSVKAQEQSEIARHIFKVSVSSVIPADLVRSKIILNGNILSIDNKENVDLADFQNVYIIGFGKAVLEMSEEIINILGPRCTDCIVSVPEGTRIEKNPKIRTYRGAKNNIPDENALFAANKIVDLVKSCGEDDLLIVLISGGGSALFPMPKKPITLQEKSSIIKKLSQAGATINELNTVRKKLSMVKNGGLVEVSRAKKIISIIMSDVLEDRLDIIASGPTVYSEDSGESVRSIISKYVPDFDTLPESILSVLHENTNNMKNSKNFLNTSNFIIGNNKLALNSASKATFSTLYTPCILTCCLQGEARVIGAKLSELADFIGNMLSGYEKVANFQEFLHKLQDDKKLHLERDFSIDLKRASDLYSTLLKVKEQESPHRICLLLGGETTVTVKGKGVGGRNQELCLSAGIKLYEIKPEIRKPASYITILSGGTDGIDGPCSAAGAVVNSTVIRDALSQKLDAIQSLNENDSFNFFRKLSNGLFHVVTGHTGTNVMDIIIVLIESESPCFQKKSKFLLSRL